MDLSIIIPTKDRNSILINTLEALKNCKVKFSFEVILINDSKTQTIEMFDSDLIKVFNNPKTGAASARNYGATLSNSNFLLFLDDDILLDSSTLSMLYETTIANNKLVYLPNWQYPAELLERIKENKFGRFLIHINYTSLKGWIGSDISWENVKTIEHEGIASYCLLLKRKEFMDVSMYDEKFPFAGFEDYDLSKKLLNNGFKIFILPEITVFHNESDRINLKPWLERKKRTAITQRKAVELGYSEVQLNFNPFKKLVLSTGNFLRPLFLTIAFVIPNLILFDSIYRKVVNILTGIYIYKGYKFKDEC